MDVSRNFRNLVLFSLTFIPFTANAMTPVPPHRHHHRTELSLPTSGPLGLEDFAKLPEWSQVQRITHGIQGGQAALSLLKELPLVAEKYADPSFFEDFVGKWRDRIPDLTNYQESSVAQNSSWVIIENGGDRSIYATFPVAGRHDGYTIMRIGWNDGQVADLNIFAGFGHPLPLTRHRRVRSVPTWN
jgi:hypothetical protein